MRENLCGSFSRSLWMAEVASKQPYFHVKLSWRAVVGGANGCPGTNGKTSKTVQDYEDLAGGGSWGGFRLPKFRQIVSDNKRTRDNGVKVATISLYLNFHVSFESDGDLLLFRLTPRSDIAKQPYP